MRSRLAQFGRKNNELYVGRLVWNRCELNRLRMEHRASLSNARAELAAVGHEIRKLVQAIKDGAWAFSIQDELLSLEARKVELQSRADAPEMPELLHPRMADVYREKVQNLSTEVLCVGAGG